VNRLTPRLVGRVVLGVVGLAVGVAAVLALREATLSTHQPVAADSQVEVVVESETLRRERHQTAAEMTEALFLACRLEISSDLVGRLESVPDPEDEDDDDVDDGRFRAVMRPAFDETNERQFRGCLEDWTLDQLLVDVISIRPIDTGSG
jgi:hypothetical protein